MCTPTKKERRVIFKKGSFRIKQRYMVLRVCVSKACTSGCSPVRVLGWDHYYPWLLVGGWTLSLAIAINWEPCNLYQWTSQLIITNDTKNLTCGILTHALGRTTAANQDMRSFETGRSFHGEVCLWSLAIDMLSPWLTPSISRYRQFRVKWLNIISS